MRVATLRSTRSRHCLRSASPRSPPARSAPFVNRPIASSSGSQQRLTTVLPALMKKHGIDMWVVPMREYNEDPVFSSLVSPTTFAARRRTIYVFFDKCAAGATSATSPNGKAGCVERIALGGTSQGGLYDAVRSTRRRRRAGRRAAGRALGGSAVARAQGRRSSSETRKSSGSMSRVRSRSPTV